jgi:signal transduction histidine kinase
VRVIGSEPLRRRRIRPTLRLRLTLLYGGCFIVAGAGLLAITYALFANGTGQSSTTFVPGVALSIPVPRGYKAIVTGSAGSQQARFGGPSPRTKFTRSPPSGVLQQVRRSGQKQLDRVVNRANFLIRRQHDQSLTSLLEESGIALAVMALLSIGLGWLLAGRALSPLRTMNQQARRITEDTLHERLGLTGREDELGELAATFDAVLARLEQAFDSQRQFVANASHELRTPITLERTLLEVALADPDVSLTSLRRTCERVLAAGEQQERVIDALLTLARGQAGLETAEPVELDRLVARLIEARQVEFVGMRLSTKLDPLLVSGDPGLLERMVANLLDNAIVHNAEEDPWVTVTTGEVAGRSELRLSNGGPAVPTQRVNELFEPFRRLDGDRVGAARGLGLGLSIVRAVVLAHGGEVQASPVPGGGLELVVRLDLPASKPDRRAPQPERRDAVLHSEADASTDELLAGSDRLHR